MDETNVKFYDVSGIVLALQGMKGFGTACSILSSDGCTIIVAMDM